jgi:hypothetical protein
MNHVVIRAAAILGTFVALQACTTLPRLAAVPPTQTARAIVPGFANSRYWLDEDFPALRQEALGDDKHEREALARLGISTDPMPPAHVLAISGGGDAGAFAAGLLSGWSSRGTRPQFRLVTGISAGALIAPFAYLGPAYDDVIRTVATSVGPDDVFDRRNVLAGLASDGMADSAPLASLIEKYVTPETLAAIAAEYSKGRALQIATTDLDSGRPVIWNMGAIAASQTPGALQLFRKIMIASASIPGVVSPVLFDVEVRVANDTDYALTAGFFSRSPANIERIKAELVAGNVYINRSCTGAVVGRHPFGGFKMSGGGTKAGGADYLLQFVVPRVVTENIMRHGFAPDTTPEFREAFGETPERS